MSVATLRYDEPRSRGRTPLEPRHQRCDGRLELVFTRSRGVTVLAELDQRSPCRALFPRPQPASPPLAVLVNIAGGLAGGDRIAVSVAADSGAAATVTNQAAEKVYRSLGPDARVEVQVRVADDARIEWLPQETILFDGACLDRSLCASVADRGRLLAAEMLIFGRAARGETMRCGRLRDSWRIERGGRVVWVDRLGMSRDIAARLDGAGFGGARALATLLYVGSDAEAALPAAREAAGDLGGATLVNGLLLSRLLGSDPRRVRDGLARLVGLFRDAGLPPLWAQ